jgi:hypothetical protein
MQNIYHFLYIIFTLNIMNANPSSNGSNGIDLAALAQRFGQYFIENITAISIVVVIMIGALVYQEIMHVQQGSDITENDAINSSASDTPGTKTVIVETFDNANNDNANANNDNNADMDTLDAKLKAGFCKSHLGKPAELETECGKLSKNSCTATSCCVWASMNSVESCMSGNRHGPIFKHGNTDTPKTLDYYYFENKCNGNCPSAAAK